jgi:hypothetical protein
MTSSKPAEGNAYFILVTILKLRNENESYLSASHHEDVWRVEV